MKKHAMILFSRLPIPGQTKTRLMPALSGAECAALHNAMLADIALVLHRTGKDLFVFYTPDGFKESLEQFKELVGGAVYLSQAGSGLGQRMYHAVSTVLDRGYADCLLVGSDMPFLTLADIDEADRQLAGCDLTLAPSRDGGYWLIGLKRPLKPVLEQQAYGTATVLEQTITCCNRYGLRVGLANPGRDIDLPEDLLYYYHQIQAGRVSKDMHTARLILSLGKMKK